MKFEHVILLVLSISLLMGYVSAEGNVYFNNTTNTTFEDVDFTIPAGFSQNDLPQDYDELGSHGKTTYFNSSNGEKIVITVIYDWMGMSLEEMYFEGANKTTINNHEGWKYIQDNLTCFGYVDGDHGIIVSTNNESRLSEVII